MNSGKKSFNTNNERTVLAQIIDNTLINRLQEAKQAACADLISGKRDYLFLPMATLYSDVAVILAEPARVPLTNKVVLDCARKILPEVNYAIVGQGYVEDVDNDYAAVAATMSVYSGSPSILGSVSIANLRYGVYLAANKQGIDKAMDVKAEIENPVVATCKKLMRFVRGGN